MARSPLFGSLRCALRIATASARSQPGTPPIDELLDMAYTRRRFLRDSAAATAALATGAWSYGCDSQAAPTPPEGVRIVIVGAGLAGLNTAYKLQKVGLRASVFEGSDRTGGRTFTAKDLLGAGLTTELGGEFIDSGHQEMLALMGELGLERMDRHEREVPALKRETYFIQRRHYSQAQTAREFVPLAKQILGHYDSMKDVVNYASEGRGGAFDRMSMAEYFDSIDAKGWMRELLEVAYVTEYGLEADEQSALNFIFLIATGKLGDMRAFELLGKSDERYKVRGGNQRIADELARCLEQQIQRRHRLEAIKSKGEGFTLTFQSDGSVVDEDADIVVLAIPFTLLREVNMRVELQPLKRIAIEQLGYGHNAKVLMGFNTKPWRKLGYCGSIYTDEAFQLAWDNSFLQHTAAGGLTLYSGGRRGLEVGNGTPEQVAAKLMTGVERAYPGATRERNGKVARFHWPSFPWTKGSYACYKPGQWTTIAGSEGLPAGNLFFAGEHCSYDFQGYMNGAAQSGLDTAKAIMARLSGSKAAHSLLSRHQIRVRVGQQR